MKKKNIWLGVIAVALIILLFVWLTIIDFWGADATVFIRPIL